MSNLLDNIPAMILAGLLAIAAIWGGLETYLHASDKKTISAQAAALATAQASVDSANRNANHNSAVLDQVLSEIKNTDAIITQNQQQSQQNAVDLADIKGSIANVKNPVDCPQFDAVLDGLRRQGMPGKRGAH